MRGFKSTATLVYHMHMRCAREAEVYPAPGARELITVEYNPIVAEKSGLRTMTPREMAQAWLAGEFAEARHLCHRPVFLAMAIPPKSPACSTLAC